MAGLQGDHRIRVQLLQREHSSTLAADALRGLRESPKHIPPKHFYDARGSELFDRICETDEYYPTRTELALLQQIAPLLMDALRPTDVIELGSGTARKTRVLFDAAEHLGIFCRYVPFDVSESALRRSSHSLLVDYPWLRISAVVGDYERHLELLPSGERRLFVFLGGTIGNFDEAGATTFLRTIRRAMRPNDRLLLGTDLVKEASILDRAYNDAAGLTETFNKNVLLVMNRQLRATFNPDTFRHVAFFNPEHCRVEMHLESLCEQVISLAALPLEVRFRAGERLLTEISRKFTKATVAQMLDSAGLALQSWHTPLDGAFGLSVSAPQ